MDSDSDDSLFDENESMISFRPRSNHTFLIFSWIFKNVLLFLFSIKIPDFFLIFYDLSL